MLATSPSGLSSDFEYNLPIEGAAQKSALVAAKSRAAISVRLVIHFPIRSIVSAKGPRPAMYDTKANRIAAHHTAFERKIRPSVVDTTKPIRAAPARSARIARLTQLARDHHSGPDEDSRQASNQAHTGAECD